MNNIRFGIVGPSDRAHLWEQRLRPIASVPEVILSKEITTLGNVDACIILSDDEQALPLALQAIRMGMNIFLVSRIPTDRKRVQLLYHTAEEANVVLQFSHWATFAPSSQWMMEQIRKPKLIHVRKDVPHSVYLNYDAPFEYLWIEDLGLVLKWMNSQVHHIEANMIKLNERESIAIQIYLRFENSSTCEIFVNTMSSESRHERFGANNQVAVQCDVLNKYVRIAKSENDNQYYFEKKQMEESEPADIALNMFIKSIQMHRPSAFSGYDALQLATLYEKITDLVSR